IAPFFPKMGKPWTSKGYLPGGDIANADFEQFLGDLGREYPWMPTSLVKHYGRLYGTRTRVLVGAARSLADLGRCFGKDFFEREANYLFEHEWALTAADFLERRTKHGLHLSAAERAAFEDW
ncbi:MAG: glycerol-3-phosphate dehydrogenase, partial [Mesorhizobium sp.]